MTEVRSTVDIKPSAMKIVFRVVDQDGKVLTTCNDYQGGEKFCWEHPGHTHGGLGADELHIEKVWVPK